MTTINISDDLVNEAKRYAQAFSRSTPKQIEHWAKIGKLVEENPDLPFTFVRDTLLGLQEIEQGQTEPYEFSIDLSSDIKHADHTNTTTQEGC